jgi:hypothetical protein
VIYHFSLAKAIPLNGTATYAEIEIASGIKESICRRLIRYAILNHIFCEPSPGIVAHTAVSRMMVENQDVQDWIGHNVDEGRPPALRHTPDLGEISMLIDFSLPRSRENIRGAGKMAQRTAIS